jgi:mevalonate kinase
MDDTILYRQRVPGKILLSGEYLVLDGAKSLGLVSRMGQSIQVEADPQSPAGTLSWTALDQDGIAWLKARMVLENNQWSLVGDTTYIPENQRLLQGIQASLDLVMQSQAEESTPVAFTKHPVLQSLSHTGLRVTTALEFPRRWGLGSSSTLVALLAGWWEVNARQLYALVQNGSGYDLEIALNAQSIVYQREPLQVRPVDFRIPEGSMLRLVDPGSKQISASEVTRYRNLDLHLRNQAVPRVSQISETLAKNPSIQEMLELLREHDEILEGVLGQPCLHALEGHGFPGRLKSLGAWGGDLFLAASDQPQKAIEWLDNHVHWSSYPLEDIVQVSNP